MSDSVAKLDEPAGSGRPAESLDQRPYDPAEDREKLRGHIAVALLALFAAIVLTLLISAITGWVSDDRIEKLAGVLIAPVSGLLGAVIGFYYGEQAHARD